MSPHFLLIVSDYCVMFASRIAVKECNACLTDEERPGQSRGHSNCDASCSKIRMRWELMNKTFDKHHQTSFDSLEIYFCMWFWKSENGSWFDGVNWPPFFILTAQPSNLRVYSAPAAQRESELKKWRKQFMTVRSRRLQVSVWPIKGCVNLMWTKRKINLGTNHIFVLGGTENFFKNNQKLWETDNFLDYRASVWYCERYCRKIVNDFEKVLANFDIFHSQVHYWRGRKYYKPGCLK